MRRATRGCALTGGSIGQGMPLSIGAAVACPDRRVLTVQADGSAMYTLQALWTQGREALDVTTVICNNRSYSVLNMELQRVGAAAVGPKALDMLDLHRPDIDFVALAEGLGVPASAPPTTKAFTEQVGRRAGATAAGAGSMAYSPRSSDGALHEHDPFIAQKSRAPRQPSPSQPAIAMASQTADGGP